MKKFYIFLSLMLVICTSLNATTISRNETVYVNLRADGQTEKIEVVTWLKTDGQGSASDLSSLKQIKNVKGTDQPAISGSTVKFASSPGNIFYRGTTSQALPLGVKISYKLDGKPISAQKLNGKSGQLDLSITLSNKTGVTKTIYFDEVGTGERMRDQEKVYVPFVATVAMDLDIEKFEAIDAPGAAFAAAESGVHIDWLTAPMPDQTIRLSARVKDLSLPGITITAYPKMVPLPDKIISRIESLNPKLNSVYGDIDTMGGNLDNLYNEALKLSVDNALACDTLLESPVIGNAMLKELEAQVELVDASLQINEKIRSRIKGVKYISCPLTKMFKALWVQDDLLARLLDGGAFDEQTIEFLEDSTGQASANFSSSINSLRDSIIDSQATKQDKIDNLLLLKQNAVSLADNLQLAKIEGTDEIKIDLSRNTRGLVKKLASIDTYRKLAEDYDRFSGQPSAIASSVQFIMKTSTNP